MQIWGASIFVDNFQSRDVEGSIQNVYHLTGLPGTGTTPNLFELLINDEGCSEISLTELYTIIHQLMIYGGQQVLAFYSLKGLDEIGKTYSETLIHQMYDIRTMYNQYLSICYNNAVPDAIGIMQATLRDKRDSSNDEVVNQVFGKVTYRYPFFAWGVVSTENTDLFDYNKWWDRGSGLGYDRCIPYKSDSGIDAVFGKVLGQNGRNFYSETKEIRRGMKRRAALIWQDSSLSQMHCQVKSSLETSISFLPCNRCIRDGLRISGTLLSKDFCKGESLELPGFSSIKYYERQWGFWKSECSPTAETKSLLKTKITAEVDRWQWIAATEPESQTLCKKNDCSDHGVCRQIPYTSRTLCFCASGYSGENCEIADDTTLLDEINELVAEIRRAYGGAVLIPDIIDIYIEIKDVSSKLEQGISKIQDNLEYLKWVVIYNKPIQEVDYIAKLYTQVIDHKIDDSEFVRDMDGYLRNRDIKSILHKLGDAILGSGILDRPGNGDFMSIYKRDHVARNNDACKNSYVTEINRMRKDMGGGTG